MKQLTILSLLLCAFIFSACSSDDDYSEKRYNWELKIESYKYNEDGTLDNTVTNPSYWTMEFTNKTEKEVDQYIKVEFSETEGCSFYKCKRYEIISGPTGKYWESTGTKTRLN